MRPRRLLLRSALTARELTALDLGEPFRARYGAPYVVMHRSDLLAILYEACREAGVGLQAGKDVLVVTGDEGAATAECADGTSDRPRCWSPPTACTPESARCSPPTGRSARASPPSAARPGSTR